MSRAKKTHRAILAVMLLFPSVQVLQANGDLKTVEWERDWGVRPIHARVTANGYMIEFRYRVVDPEKAVILSDRKDFPYMLSQKSRARLSVPYFPTVGFIKSNRKFLKSDRNYTAMFSNEGIHLLRGDRVRIQVRDQLSPIMVLQ